MSAVQRPDMPAIAVWLRSGPGPVSAATEATFREAVAELRGSAGAPEVIQTARCDAQEVPVPETT